MQIPVTYSWSVGQDWQTVKGESSQSTSTAVFCPRCGGIVWGVTMLVGAYPCKCQEMQLTRPVDDLAAVQLELTEVKRMLSLILEKLEGNK